MLSITFLTLQKCMHKMASATSTNVTLHDASQAVSIPLHPTARLMYYMDCICNLIDIDDNPHVRRLRDYNNYHLDGGEIDLLLKLVVLIKPENLFGKCLFINEKLCSQDSNRFLEVSSVRKMLTVTDSFRIAGIERSIRMIMVCKQQWLHICPAISDIYETY